MRCVKQFLITKMRYPPLIAQFGTRFFKCSEYMKLRQNHVTCRLWKTLEPQICLKCLWNCFQRVQRPQIDLQLTWFGLQSFHFGGVNDFPIFGDYLAYQPYSLRIPPPSKPISDFWRGDILTKNSIFELFIFKPNLSVFLVYPIKI